MRAPHIESVDFDDEGTAMRWTAGDHVVIAAGSDGVHVVTNWPPTFKNKHLPVIPWSLVIAIDPPNAWHPRAIPGPPELAT